MVLPRLRCLQIINSSYKGFLLSKTHKDVHSLSVEQFQKMSSQANNSGNRLVWVDMEMTGLDPDVHHILEVACLITDGDLNIIAEGPDLVVRQSPEVISGMNDWCQIHHNKSGLVDASNSSNISLKEAEDALLTFVEAHTPKGKCPLAGNSVYGDRMFLKKFMPRLDSHLHYRLVDVSTVKELCRRWFPEEFSKAPEKNFAHRSLSDIKESIKELQYYKKAIFNVPTDVILGSVSSEDSTPVAKAKRLN